MDTKRLELLILIVGIIVGGIVFGSQIQAQGERGVGISPLTFELTANPGDAITNQVKVYNPGAGTVGIKMETEDFAVSGEIGHVTVEPPETETYSIARWVTFEPQEFALDPGEQKFVTFTISVPENAEPGGHYGAVLAGTSGIIGEEFMGAAVAGRVGALVLLSVAGEIKEDLRVKEFFAPSYSEYGPIPFTIKFENRGTIHVKPAGFVTITDWYGKKVADIEFSQNNVLPNSVRKIETSLDKKWFFAGKYTATLTGSYGISNTSFTPVVITFWAFPWKVGLGILIVIILLILSRKRWVAAFRILIKGEK